MLDIRAIRQNPDTFKEKLFLKKVPAERIDELLAADEAWRHSLAETERLKALRNASSEAIAVRKKNGEDATDEIAEMKNVGQQIKQIDDHVRRYEALVQSILLDLPNLPHDSVPLGNSESENPILRTFGHPPTFDFKPKPHFEVAENLDILDIERAVKITGSRFVLYKGLGARLERALASFMLDFHTMHHGYTEIFPAFIANEESLIGVGNLPKFGDEMFKLEGMPYYLIPTAEVPLTNYYRDEILSMEQVPVKFAGFSSCFRSEAGSAGKDTRGLIRLHQFQKVELVNLCLPEHSYEVLEQLTKECEAILQALELPYQVIEICTGDLGSKDAKKYDIEVWIPASNTYREISSCTNFEEFQSRRANLRFRRDEASRPEYLHTLNGTGLAVGRTVAAILENNQERDGSVRIPNALIPYMGGISRIEKMDSGRL